MRIRFTNELPPTHILPVDTSLPGAQTGQAENRTAVHLHGGLVPWTSDGGPFDWWTPGGPNYAQGASFLNGPGGFLDTLPGYNTMVPGQADYLYPNNQSYRLTWYHEPRPGHHPPERLRRNSQRLLDQGFGGGKPGEKRDDPPP